MPKVTKQLETEFTFRSPGPKAQALNPKLSSTWTFGFLRPGGPSNKYLEIHFDLEPQVARQGGSQTPLSWRPCMLQSNKWKGSEQAWGAPGVCQFPRVAVTNYNKLGGLTQQKCDLSLFRRPEVWNQGVSKIVSFRRLRISFPPLLPSHPSFLPSLVSQGSDPHHGLKTLHTYSCPFSLYASQASPPPNKSLALEFFLDICFLEVPNLQTSLWWLKSNNRTIVQNRGQ